MTFPQASRRRVDGHGAGRALGPRSSAPFAFWMPWHFNDMFSPDGTRRTCTFTGHVDGPRLLGRCHAGRQGRMGWGVSLLAEFVAVPTL